MKLPTLLLVTTLFCVLPAHAQCMLRGAPDYKGFKMLGRINDFQKRFPEFTCEPSGAVFRECVNASGTYANVDAQAMATFFNGALFKIKVAVGADEKDKIIAGLEAKYGKPTTSRERCGRKVDTNNDHEWLFQANHFIEAYSTADDKNYIVEMTALSIADTPAFKKRVEERKRKQRQDM